MVVGMALKMIAAINMALILVNVIMKNIFSNIFRVFNRISWKCKKKKTI